MPTLSTRAAFQQALTAEDRATRDLFKNMSAELIALINRSAGDDGKIPPQSSETVRQQARAIVSKYFVQTRPINGVEAAKERQKLNALLTLAQKQMKTATERQKAELRLRVGFLGKRLALLERGLVVVSIDDKGNGVTPFARTLVRDLRGIVHAVVGKHSNYVRSVISRSEKV
jgi:hypothetical protein